MEVKFSKIIIISLLLIILPACKSDNITRLDQKYNKYFLPKDVLPMKDYIKLIPNIHNDTFTEYVKILIKVIKSTNNITIHQKGLVVLSYMVYLMTKTDSNRDEKIRNNGISEFSNEEIYVIHFNNKLEEYYGVYQDKSMVGLDSVTYQNENNATKRIIISYFEPTYARYTFLCFDEPALKSTFKSFILRPTDYRSASSGMLIKSTHLNNSLVEDEFEETVKLSTYKISFLVYNLTLSKKLKDNMHQALALPEHITEHREKYSIKLSNQAYQDLEIFVDKKLPLKKIYHVAVPNSKMVASAMENWRLITYQDYVLLLPDVKSISIKEEVAGVVIHELVHRWFGNLVTLKWWDYVWLKEGFATYLAYVINEKINSMFRDFQNRLTLPADLEELMLCDAMRRGQETNMFYLFNKSEFKNQKESSRFLTFECSRNITTLQRFLMHSLSSVCTSNLVQTIEAVINAGRLGSIAVLRFMRNNPQLVLLIKLGRKDMKMVLTSLGSKITKEEDLQALQKLFIHEYLKNNPGNGTVAFSSMGINIFVIVVFYAGAGILREY